MKENRLDKLNGPTNGMYSRYEPEDCRAQLVPSASSIPKMPRALRADHCEVQGSNQYGLGVRRKKQTRCGLQQVPHTRADLFGVVGAQRVLCEWWFPVSCIYSWHHLDWRLEHLRWNDESHAHVSTE